MVLFFGCMASLSNLKLISLNFERSRHLERNIPFLRKEQPDILCGQEVFEGDIERISSDLDMPFRVWLRDTLIGEGKNVPGKGGYSGIVLFSRYPLSRVGYEYYHVPESGITEEKTAETCYETNANGIVWASIEVDGREYAFVNTHFTWSVADCPNDAQRVSFVALRNLLEKLGPNILSGDLNAPRGRGMWEEFVSFYGQDNIPKEITTTIDQELHRKKGLQLVVDGIFAQAPYAVNDIRVVPGMSDHQAIVASVSYQEIE